jgi:hypothetical protein
MANGIVSHLPKQKSTARPPVTSYDSAYEYSLDRYVNIKSLVEVADLEASDVPATLAFAS